MRAKHDATQGYYTTIATKISNTDKQKLCIIAQRFGLSFYELLQGLLLALVRYFDTDTPISDRSRTMLQAFTNIMFATDGSFSPLSIKGYEKECISNAILFVRRQEDQRAQILSIGKDEQGRPTESYNADKMLADFLQAYDPKTLKALEAERKKLDSFSIGHTLHELVVKRTCDPADTMSEEISSLFDDVRIPIGLKINEDVYYKRKLNRGEYSQVFQQRTNYKSDL